METTQIKSPSKNEQIKVFIIFLVQKDDFQQNLAIVPTVENLRLDASYSKDRSNSKSPSRALTPKQTLTNLEMAIAAVSKYK